MEWAVPKYSKTRVNKAGLVLKATDPDGFLYPVEWNETLAIINNWRSIHALPLQTVKMTLWQRAHKIARRTRSKALIAQRTKRLESIWNKLRLEPTMKLTTMQDIGGCRAVLRSMGEANDLIRSYEANIAAEPSNGPKFIERYDYINAPAETGYRSMHYVYQYRPTGEKHACYEGLRIEVQIRSQLQHVWATAVETVSVLTKQALKSNIGSDDWKRFFALMGSALAVREKTAPVPGTPTNTNELRDELRHHALALQVDHLLGAYSGAVELITGNQAIKPTPAKFREGHFFLVVLDPVIRNVRVTSYDRSELALAETEYLEAEKKLDREKGMQAVLVSADSIKSLKRAYPNYFLDTSEFVLAVTMAMGKDQGSPS